jgi:uroporphyrinogen decarboxylase
MRRKQNPIRFDVPIISGDRRMTSRERVLASLDHREPDRVPIDLGGHRSSGVAAMAYARLKRALGIRDGDVYVYDVVQQLAVVEPPVLDALGVDVIELGRGFLTDADDWKDWTLPDGTPCKVPAYVRLERRGEDWLLCAPDGRALGVQKKGCLYFEQTYFPCYERSFEDDDFSDLVDVLGRTMWTAVPHPGAHLPLDDAVLAELTRRARSLRASTDRAIVGLFGGNLFEIPQWLFGMENYLAAVALHPDAALRFTERLCDIHLRNLDRWLGAVGPSIDVILFGDDLGGQNGPLLSPAMYRRLLKPYHARLWRRSKERANVKVMLHCCGGIRPLIPDLIEAGVDAINPVQISCAGMDAAGLKADFGKDLVFWGGGCDTRSVLPRGTPAAVRDHVRRQIEILFPGGGFVFQQVHNIQADVPAENILAMIEAAREGDASTRRLQDT